MLILICKMTDIKKILIVDDEADLREILKFNLECNGFITDVAESAEEALEMSLESYDLFILDVMMDGMSGFDLLKMMRLNMDITVPVIFITALGSEANVLEGFKIGADDYVRKPFSVKEVVARVKAILERSFVNKLSLIESSKGINFDSMKKRVFVNNSPIDFTRTEYDIFELLYTNPGKVHSREEILKLIWADEQYVLGRTVDVNITRIRKKLGDWGQCIVTRSGYGYYFDDKKIEEISTQLKAV